MPGKDTRKIITDKGHITLPQVYRDYNELKKGDEVEILFDSVLVVRPNGLKLSAKKRKALKALLE